MRIVIALGGNALLKRGQPLTAANQLDTLRGAARALAALVAAGHQLILTHGNGPQVGLLALQSAAGPAESALPLDVLDAESEGWIGFAIERELRNALPVGTEVATLLTQIVVARDDPAFAAPAKPIGPMLDEAAARLIAATHHWSIAPDGEGWRRVVASPRPQAIVEIGPIQRLIEAGVIVICAGGGGIPVAAGVDGRMDGVEAVIDKDAASALLAQQVAADLFVMLTDVSGVYLDYGTEHARLIGRADPDALRRHGEAFKAGSMGPKVAAAVSFVAATGRPAAIGALADLSRVIDGDAGTRIISDSGAIGFRTA